MKHICKNCEHWKTYINRENMCLCEGGLSPGSLGEIYSFQNDTCKCWEKRKQMHFKKFRDNIKIKTSVME